MQTSDQTKTARAREVDDHFLPGVSFNLDGEVLPARELAWAMFASCGCVAALHMMTTDTINEEATWKQLSGSAQMIKRDKARGFTIRMVKHREVPFDDCPHSPKFGYMPPPTPAGHSWATTSRVRALHLVPLTRVDDKDASEEWTVGSTDWRTKFTSFCGKVSEPAGLWTRKWYRSDGKIECSRCVKLAEAQVLIPDEAFTHAQ